MTTVDNQLISAIREEIQKLAFIYKDTLSINEAARFSDYSKEQLYKLREERKVLTFQPDGGKIFFDKDSLRDHMRKNPKATQETIDFIAANHKRKAS